MSEPDIYNLRDETAREAEAAESSRLSAALEANDWKWQMSSARGRRLVYRLLERTGIYRTSMTGNSYTFFNEGQRNVGLFIQAIITEHCPEEYAKMLVEKKDYAK